MNYDYLENIFVQENTADLLQNELGWQEEFVYNKEVLGEQGTFGQRNHHEILLIQYFQAALKKARRQDRDENRRCNRLPVSGGEPLPDHQGTENL